MFTCQDGFYRKRPLGRFTFNYYEDDTHLLLTLGAFLRMYSQEGLLDFRNENMWSLTWVGSASPSCDCLLLGVSVHRRQTPAAQPGAHPNSCLTFFLPGTFWLSYGPWREVTPTQESLHLVKQPLRG